jgi:hypothetical protein
MCRESETAGSSLETCGVNVAGYRRNCEGLDRIANDKEFKATLKRIA